MMTAQCPCPRPLSVETVVIECDNFKDHLNEMVRARIETEYAELVQEWEQEILWGRQRPW